ncbi:MAG TPA: TauD/TfdA family dioxygenase [Herpetosiphonaceae bacterium]
MSLPDSDQPQARKIGALGRRAISTAAESMVKTGSLTPGQLLPLLIEPRINGVDLVAWAGNNQQLIATLLQQHGGILFRNFNLQAAETFDRLVAAAVGDALPYQERSSPRSQVQKHIYTSTEHPADQSIFLHNEQSYNLTFPQHIAFCCLTAARHGGETPIADCRKVFESIDPQIRERFLRQNYMYVRNYGGGMGLSWQDAFQTDDRERVQQYCQANQIAVEWLSADRLRTRQVRRVAAAHPQSGAMTWFNHLTFFHVSTLEPQARIAVQAEFSEADLPSNTYYGDGSPIEPEVLDHLRAAYHQATVTFPWQNGDVLLLDNMLVAHGRAPFGGPRSVVVAMAGPVSWTDLPPISPS